MLLSYHEPPQFVFLFSISELKFLCFLLYLFLQGVFGGFFKFITNLPTSYLYLCLHHQQTINSKWTEFLLTFSRLYFRATQTFMPLKHRWPDRLWFGGLLTTTHVRNLESNPQLKNLLLHFSLSYKACVEIFP